MHVLEAARVYLGIVEALAYSIPETGVPSIAPVLVDKMGQLLHRLAVQRTNNNAFAANMNAHQQHQSRSTSEKALAFWFSTLLRMVVIHRPAFISKTSNLNMIDQIRLLVSIFCIALSRLPSSLMRIFPIADYFPHPHAQDNDKGHHHHQFRPCPPGILLHTHALDVAVSLLDAFPDEVRQKCARFLRERCPPFLNFQTDPRFVYLLGPITSSASSLSSADSSAPTSQQPTSTSLPSPAASGSTPVPTTPSLNPSTAASPQPPNTSNANNANNNNNTTGAAGIFSGLLSADNRYMDGGGRLQIHYRGRTLGPYPLRPWELLEDAAPLVGGNDTAVGLGYFDARREKA